MSASCSRYHSSRSMPSRPPGDGGYAGRCGKLTALAVEYDARQHVTGFAQVELNQNAPPVSLVVEEIQQVNGLDDAAEFGKRACQPCRTGARRRHRSLVGLACR